MALRNRKSVMIGIAATAAVLLLSTWRSDHAEQNEAVQASPTSEDDATTPPSQISMADLLEMAKSAHRHMQDSLEDYTARFVKQEIDTQGVLGEEHEMQLKIQSPVRNDSNDAAKRVYLKFMQPEANRGREVLWAADLNDGKMAVHENYFPLSLKTIWLDPNGYLAMQGQKYPISEIGLVRLVEKLIERGAEDLDNPDISISINRDHVHDERPAKLIRVRRSKPSGKQDDFSLAEITIDIERNLVVGYRSFGWPAKEGEPPPLLESYFYYDLETNVGLSEQDFDPTNSQYEFP